MEEVPIRHPYPVTDDATGPGPLAPVRRRPGLATGFRMAGSHRPDPPPTRVVVMYAWATGLGVAGLMVAARGLFAILASAGPDWYEPTLASVGLGAVGLTTGAMLSARRLRLPWIMLGLATVPLLVNVGLTIGAL